MLFFECYLYIIIPIRTKLDSHKRRKLKITLSLQFSKRTDGRKNQCLNEHMKDLENHPYVNITTKQSYGYKKSFLMFRHRSVKYLSWDTEPSLTSNSG